MIEQHLQRAHLLYRQGRFDLAIEAVHQCLAESPDNAIAHALLGLCLLQKKQYDAATSEAQTSIVHAPDNPFCHYALGIILQERNLFAAAEVAARDALRLRPDDPDYWSLLAYALFSQERWKESLAAADAGLATEAEHQSCINVRAMALVKLGDKEAAAASIAGALQRNPHNANTHANQGWTLLHQAKYPEALEHFREALRINPDNAWARQGMTEALKARHLLYRIMLRYYLWMSRFSRGGQWGIIIGIWAGMQALRIVKESYPDLQPVIVPVLMVGAVFVAATWLAVPLFNLTLLFSSFGRYLLTRTQITGAVLVAVFLLSGIVCAISSYFLNNDFLFDAGLLLALFTLPVAATTCIRDQKRLALMSGYTVLVMALAVIGMIMQYYDLGPAQNFILASILGCALASLASNALSSIIQTK